MPGYNNWYTMLTAKEIEASRRISMPKFLASALVFAVLGSLAFPFNSVMSRQVYGQVNQIIKVRLRLSGPDNEWIRIETSNNGAGGTVLTAYHTKRVRQTLLSNLATGLVSFGAEELASEAIDGYDGPVPVPGINFYRWAEHETRRIVFVPVGCSDNSSTPLDHGQQLGQPSCVITGTNSITLPAGIDIRVGLLTIEYAEQDLVRTITFKVPPERV